MEINCEIDELMGQSERVVEFSGRKPQVLLGVVCGLIGIYTVIESFWNQFDSILFIGEFVLGLIFLYITVWILIFCRNEYICVTNERVLYRKITLLGKRGKIQSYLLRDIASVRLCRAAINVNRQTHSGEILLVLENRKKYIFPILHNGQYILDAIRQECSKLSTSDKELQTQEKTESIAIN